MQEISITDEQLEKWWNEAQENLPEDKRRYTPSYLERREQEIQEKIKKYGVIREPEEKGFLDTLVGFGKKLAAHSFLVRPVNLPSLGVVHTLSLSLNLIFKKRLFRQERKFSLSLKNLVSSLLREYRPLLFSLKRQLLLL